MKILKIIKYAICLLFGLILLLSIIFITTNKSINIYELPYKETSIDKIEYDITPPSNTSYQTLIDDINKMFDNPKYELSYTDFDSSIKGKCYIYTRQIILQENLNYEYFTFCLTHELVHLTEFTFSERYTNLKAYTKLYNSGNEYFKNIALYIANLDLQGAFTEEYSFVGYIEL